MFSSNEGEVDMTKSEILKIEGLDDTDKVILGILFDDARASYTEIASRVGLTRPAVKNRIVAMEERGIIAGYKTVINPISDRAGIKFVLTVNADPKRLIEVADRISFLKCFRQVYSKTGFANIIAFGYAADTKTFSDYEQLIYKSVKNMEGVNEISFHQLITTYKDVDGGVDYDAERFKAWDGSKEGE